MTDDANDPEPENPDGIDRRVQNKSIRPLLAKFRMSAQEAGHPNVDETREAA